MSFASASDVLAAHGPVCRTAELRRRGVTKSELARARAAGEIDRVRRGVYAAIDAPEAVRHAARHGGVPACSDAGRMLGLWVLDDPDDAPHIWLGDANHHYDCEDLCRPVLHWDDGAPDTGRPASVRNALLQIAACTGDEAFFVALESALRQSLFPPKDQAWLRRRLPERLRWMLEFARSDADSGLESLVRLRLHRLGIPVRTQVAIDGVGEVDILIGDLLIIEADGRQNHDDPSLRHKDLVRDANAAIRGYITLRFDYAMIVHDWPLVEQAILSRIAAGAHLRRP